MVDPWHESGDAAHDLGGATDDDRRVDALADTFEREWRAGSNPQIEEYLGRIEQARQTQLFEELLLVEVELKKRSQASVTQTDYLERFPEYGAAIVAVFDRVEGNVPTLRERSTQRQPKPAGFLSVRCPHCCNVVQLRPDDALELVGCKSCGNDFNLTAGNDDRGGGAAIDLGHFKLLERVGMGAFGSVWRASDCELDRIVAIKIPRAGQLDETLQRLFLREARSTAQLNHPHIVPVYEVGRQDDTLYIVSEFVRGATLANQLQAGRWGSRESAAICLKIADALRHAHSQGVVHRDLKPGNIMIDDAGEPRLMDFGLARRDVGEITMTLDGQILGTPAYMSPEQARGDAHAADARSDIYSLGVILFELLTGELPFRGNTQMVIKQVISFEPPSPRRLVSYVPKDLETICLKCMEKSPARRYSSASELHDDLRRFLNGVPIVARPVGPVERSWRWCRRNPLATALAAVTLGASTVIAVVSTVAYVRTSNALMQQRQSEAASNEVSKFMENLFANSSPLSSDDEVGFFARFRSDQDANLSARSVLDRGAQRIREELIDQPAVRLRLLTSMGNAYHGLGIYDQAEKLFRESLQIQESIRPEDPLAIANSMHRLSSAIGYQGRYREAESILRSALARAASAGSRGEMTATSIQISLGMLLAALNRIDDAEGVLLTAVAQREQLRSPGDPSVVYALEVLAGVYLSANLDEEAEGTFVRILQAVSLQKNASWDEAARTVGEYQRGVQALNRGHTHDAALSLQKSAESISRLLGASHPFNGVILYDLGRAEWCDSRPEAAIAAWKRAVGLSPGRIGNEHPILVYGKLTLASALFELGRLDEAKEVIHSVEPELARPGAAVHSRSANAYILLALLADHEGRNAQATKYGELALQHVGDAGKWQDKGLAPMFAAQWRRLAKLFIKEKRYDVGERSVRAGVNGLADNEALESQIERFRLLVTKAEILAATDRCDECRALLASLAPLPASQQTDAIEAAVQEKADVEKRLKGGEAAGGN